MMSGSRDQPLREDGHRCHRRFPHRLAFRLVASNGGRSFTAQASNRNSTRSLRDVLAPPQSLWAGCIGRTGRRNGGEGSARPIFTGRQPREGSHRKQADPHLTDLQDGRNSTSSAFRRGSFPLHVLTEDKLSSPVSAQRQLAGATLSDLRTMRPIPSLIIGSNHEGTEPA